MQHWQSEHSIRSPKTQAQVYRLICSKDLSPSAAPSAQDNPSCWTQGTEGPWRTRAITAASSGVLQRSVLLWSDPSFQKALPQGRTSLPTREKKKDLSHELHLKDTLKDRPMVLPDRLCRSIKTNSINARSACASKIWDWSERKAASCLCT